MHYLGQMPTAFTQGSVVAGQVFPALDEYILSSRMVPTGTPNALLKSTFLAVIVRIRL